MKVSKLAIFALLSLLAGGSQAEDRSCLVGAASQTAPTEAAKPEAALRGGQITPYEAGRLMRQQWEIAQFQRGFLEGGAAAKPACCADLNQVPIDVRAGDAAGAMAKTGVQTAVKVMRALVRETQRLIKEEQARESVVEDPAP